MMSRKIPKMLAIQVLTLSLVCSSIPVAFADENAAAEKIQPDSKVIQNVLSKIDVDYGYEIAKTGSLMSSGELGFRTAGSKGEKEAAAYIEAEMKKLGLSNVRQDAVPVDAWDFTGASLEITNSKGENKKLTLSSYAGSVGTPSEGMSGEIVYIGDGSLDGYKDQDVKGKIVLAEFDMNDDYWVTQPSYQAELKGAKAFIVAYNGGSYGTRPDALNSFDVIARDAIPIMNMSRNDAAYVKDLISKGTVEGNLVSKVDLNKVDGQSGNVIGEIPGKMKDKYIILGAHYDGYFNAFQDDILGVGVFMSVAKAILESGYEPEHTIIFVAFGAEEYGITNSHYDWVRGSWYQINENTPQWAGNTMMFLNFDTQRPDMKEFVINATPEYGKFFEKYSLSLNLPNPWTDGVVVKGTNGPWSDDYNFISAGIPGLISGKGNTDWKYQNYHTNFDTYEIYDPVTFQFNVENYIGMTLAFDQLMMPPINFAGLMEGSNATLKSDVIENAGLSDKELKAAAEKFKQASDAAYLDIQRSNVILSQMKQAQKLGAIDGQLVKEFEDALLKNRAIGMQAYKIMEKDFTKLDSWDVVMYGHEIAQTDLDAVSSAKAALEKKDGEAAKKAITGAQFGWIIPKFEKEVYRYWGIEAINPERSDIYWGTGKTLAVIDLFDVYHAIDKKVKAGDTDFTAEIEIMSAKTEQAKAAMNQVIASETSLIGQANSLVDSFTLKAAIEKGSQQLKAAYDKLSQDQKYQDVNSEYWAYDTIMGMKLEGIIESENEFKPTANASRIEIAKWLTEIYNLPTDVKEPAFSDVSSPEDMKYVAAVVKCGFMQGNGNGAFMPNESVSRAQLATIMANVLKLEASNGKSSFEDVDMNAWYSGNVEASATAGLVKGTGDGTFEPDRPISRAEACVILDRGRTR